MWELDYKESWAPKNWCFRTVVLEKTLETLRLQWDQTSQPSRKSVLNIHWKDCCWSWNCNILATWCEELTHWKRPWAWERLKVGGEANNRGWDGWMASPTWWTWVWANSRRWWRTGKPGVLQSVGSQSRTQLSNWTEKSDWSALLPILPSHDDYTWTEEVKIYSLPLDQGGIYQFYPSTLKESAKSDCKEVCVGMSGLCGHFCSLPQKRAPAYPHWRVKSIIADCPPITVFKIGTGILLSQWNTFKDV